MFFSAAAIGFAMQDAQIDPYRLDIGPKGQITIPTQKWVNTQTGAAGTADDFAKAADGFNFVFVGESHDQPEHHLNQAAAIEALVKRGRTVIVGFEMFTRPNQENLNPWTMGWWSSEEFVQKANWKTQWGFDFKIYQPIFEVIKANKLPMVALNVPREWVRAVGRGGLAALSAEQKAQLPEVYLGNEDHKKVFTGLMGGHPMTGPQGDNVYAAQCVWDEGMADSAIKYLAGRYGSVQATPKDVVMVIVAGVGHGMYKQCINYRIKKHTGMECLTLIQIESAEPATVSKGLGDFVYAAKPIKREGEED